MGDRVFKSRCICISFKFSFTFMLFLGIWLVVSLLPVDSISFNCSILSCNRMVGDLALQNVGNGVNSTLTSFIFEFILDSESMGFTNFCTVQKWIKSMSCVGLGTNWTTHYSFDPGSCTVYCPSRPDKCKRLFHTWYPWLSRSGPACSQSSVLCLSNPLCHCFWRLIYFLPRTPQDF